MELDADTTVLDWLGSGKLADGPQVVIKELSVKWPSYGTQPPIFKAEIQDATGYKPPLKTSRAGIWDRKALKMVQY